MKCLLKMSSLFFALMFVACATEQKEPTVRKEIKDVSFTARKEDSGPRKRIMILPFLDENENRPQNLRDGAREDFVRELNRGGEVIAIDSQELKLDVSSHVKGGEYAMADLAKAAQGLGVSALLEGKVIDLKVKRSSDPVGVFRQLKTTFEAKARVRIVNTRSGQEIFNTVKTVTVEEANVRVAESVEADRFFTANPEILENLLKEAFLDFSGQIVTALDKLSWEGRIAAISGDRVFLNVGRISGLQVGDVLKVSDEGDEVFDPQSGNYIGKVPGRMKGTLEVVSYFGQDGAIAIIHSGAGFRENDRIELY